MKSEILKSITGIILLFVLFFSLSYCLNYFNPEPTIEDKINEKLEQAEESPLTENEKNLVTESQTKEWEEVDKQTDK